MAADVLVVKIFDQDYKIKLGDNDPEYIKMLAKMVDDKIREFDKFFPDMDFQRLMVLVCLNVMDELSKLRKTQGEAVDVSQLLLDIKSLLDE